MRALIFTPRCKLLPQFANRQLDFDEATSTEVTQEFEIAETREVAEYIVR